MKKVIVFLLCVVLVFGNLFCSYADSEKIDEETLKCNDMFDFEQYPEVMSSEDNLNRLIRVDTDADPLNLIKYYVDGGKYEDILFPIDVKYVDTNGFTKDKSNKIYDAGNGNFESRDNNIVSTFFKNANEGVKTVNGEYAVTIIPENGGEICNAELNENTVVYRDVFGAGIDLVYRATFTGSKSDIVIRDCVVENDFIFNAIASNCRLCELEGNLVLVDEEDKLVAVFGTVVIFDATGKRFTGSLRFLSDSKFCISLPQNITEENIVYPLTIDPSITFVTSNAYGSSNIVSANINEYVCSVGGILSQSQVLSIGADYGGYEQGALIKFPGLLELAACLDSDFTSTLTLYRSSEYSGGRTYVVSNIVTSDWSSGSYYSPSMYTQLYEAFSPTIKTRTLLREGGSALTSTSINMYTFISQWKNYNYVDTSGVYGIRISLEDPDYTVYYHSPSTADSSKMPRLSISFYPDNSTDITHPIQEGIYIFTPYKTPTTKSQYQMKRMSNTSTKLATIGAPYSQAYPSTVSGKRSYILNTSMLFKIKFYNDEYYTITSLQDSKYLSYSGTTLGYNSYSGSDISSHAVWSIIKVGSKYYVLNRTGAFLYAESPNNSATTVSLLNQSQMSGSYWDLKLYCLDVEHYTQPDYCTCGPSCAWMVANYFGYDFSTFGYSTPPTLSNMNDLKAKGGNWSGNTSSYGYEQVNATLAHLLSSQNLYQSWRSPYIPSYHNETRYRNEFSNAIVANINDGKPVIVMIKFTSDVHSDYNLPFTYTSLSTKHFVVVIGTYIDYNGTRRVVIADPYPTTAPNNGGTVGYSYVDMDIDSFYYISNEQTGAHGIIQNSYTFPGV